VVNTVNEGTGKGVLPQGDRTVKCMEKTLSLREWLRGLPDLVRDTLTIRCAAECIDFPYKLVLASGLCA